MAKIAGLNGYKLINSIRISGAVAASVKDPVWKYKWVERHEPDNFAKSLQMAGCEGVFSPQNHR